MGEGVDQAGKCVGQLLREGESELVEDGVGPHLAERQGCYTCKATRYKSLEGEIFFVLPRRGGVCQKPADGEVGGPLHRVLGQALARGFCDCELITRCKSPVISLVKGLLGFRHLFRCLQPLRQSSRRRGSKDACEKR